MTLQGVCTAPAPWQLYGEGFILNYWLSPKLCQEWQSFGIAPSLLGKMIQVMVVQYHHSPVGPYDELLILDHQLSFKGRRSSIPLIYVSTEDSVVCGRENWGIPKQLAQFEWLRNHDRVYVQVKSPQGEISIQLPIQSASIPFPVNTQRLPQALLKLQQDLNGNLYAFSPQASGQAIRLNSSEWQCEGHLFPDFSLAKALGCFHIPSFNMQFPIAEIGTAR